MGPQDFPHSGQLPIHDVGCASRPAHDLTDHDARIGSRLAGATDRQLADWLKPAETRLRVVENYVADQKARLPTIERECAAIRQNIAAVRERLERPAA